MWGQMLIVHKIKGILVSKPMELFAFVLKAVNLEQAYMYPVRIVSIKSCEWYK